MFPTTIAFWQRLIALIYPRPTLDSQQNLRSLSFGAVQATKHSWPLLVPFFHSLPYQIDGYKYFSFYRALDTGDSTQDRIITPNATQWLIHALGSTVCAFPSHDGEKHASNVGSAQLPYSFTNFGTQYNPGTGREISGTNLTTPIRFGEPQCKSNLSIFSRPSFHSFRSILLGSCNDVPKPNNTKTNSYENPLGTWIVNWTLIDAGKGSSSLATCCEKT